MLKNRGSYKLFTLIALSILIIASCSRNSGDDDTSTAEGFSSETVEQLESTVEQQMSEQGIPGVMVGVWIPDRGTWTYATGTANFETDEPIEIDFYQRIASITKTFTADVILQLVTEGKMSLDDPLDQYVPEMPNGDATIRELLGMRSGIYDYTDSATFNEEFLADPLMAFDAFDAVEISRDNAPYFAPGEDFRYTDSNYMLLGLVVEEVTGNTIGAEIQTRILEPLELEHTSYPTTPEIPDPHAQGYLPDEATGELLNFTEFNPGTAGGAGAMISTLEDLRIWVKALAEGEFLSDEVQQERLQMTTFQEEPIVARYGLGIFEIAGFLGHNGGAPGYSAFAGYNPDDGGVIVVFANLGTLFDSPATGVFVKLAEALYPDNSGS